MVMMTPVAVSQSPVVAVMAAMRPAIVSMSCMAVMIMMMMVMVRWSEIRRS